MPLPLVAPFVLYCFTGVLTVVFIFVNVRQGGGASRRAVVVSSPRLVYVILLLVCCVMRVAVFAQWGSDQLVRTNGFYLVGDGCIICAKMVALCYWHECVVAFNGLKMTATRASLLADRRRFNWGVAIFCVAVALEVAAILIAEILTPYSDTSLIDNTEIIWMCVHSLVVGVITMTVGIRLHLRVRKHMMLSPGGGGGGAAAAASSSPPASALNLLGGSKNNNNNGSCNNLASSSSASTTLRKTMQRLRHFTIGAAVMSLSYLVRGIVDLTIVTIPAVSEFYYDQRNFQICDTSGLFIVEWGPCTYFLLLLFFLSSRKGEVVQKKLAIMSDVGANLLDLEGTTEDNNDK